MASRAFGQYKSWRRRRQGKGERRSYLFRAVEAAAAALILIEIYDVFLLLLGVGGGGGGERKHQREKTFEGTWFKGRIVREGKAEPLTTLLFLTHAAFTKDCRQAGLHVAECWLPRAAPVDLSPNQKEKRGRENTRGSQPPSCGK